MKRSILLSLILSVIPFTLRAENIEEPNEVLIKAFEATMEKDPCPELNADKSMIRQPKMNSSSNYTYTHWIYIEGKNVTLHIEEYDTSTTEYKIDFNLGKFGINEKEPYKCFSNIGEYNICKDKLKTTKDFVVQFYSQTDKVQSDYARKVQKNALSCTNQLLDSFKNILTANRPKK